MDRVYECGACNEAHTLGDIDDMNTLGWRCMACGRWNAEAAGHAYSVEVWICATAHIVAKDKEEAENALQGRFLTTLVVEGEDISGATFAPSMPAFSFSPMMTVHKPVEGATLDTVASFGSKTHEG